MANYSLITRYLREPLLKETGMAAAVIGTIIIITGIFGNLLFLAALFTSKRLRKLNNLYLAMMAVTSIYLLVGVYSVYIYVYIQGYWTLGIHQCLYLSICNIFCIAFILADILAMTIYRYLLIVFPQVYQKLHKKGIVVLFAVIYHLAAVAAFLPRRFSYLIHGDPSGFEVVFSVKLMVCVMAKFRNNDYTFLALFAAVLALLLYLYAHIWIVVARARKRVAQNTQRRTGWQRQPKEKNVASKQTRKDMRLIQTLLIIFLMYVLTYVIWPVVYQIGLKQPIPDGLAILSVLLFWAAGSVNWIIYGAMNEDFKIAYKALLGFGKSKMNEESLQQNSAATAVTHM